MARSRRPSHQTGNGNFEKPLTVKEGVMHRQRMNWQTVVLTAATALLLGGGASAGVGSGSGPPTSVGTGGAAASVERLATQAAVDTLKADGNAVDAAGAGPAGFRGYPPLFSRDGGGRRP